MAEPAYRTFYRKPSSGRIVLDPRRPRNRERRWASGGWCTPATSRGPRHPATSLRCRRGRRLGPGAWGRSGGRVPGRAAGRLVVGVPQPLRVVHATRQPVWVAVGVVLLAKGLGEHGLA